MYFSRPKVGYFLNRPHKLNWKLTACFRNVIVNCWKTQFLTTSSILQWSGVLCWETVHCLVFRKWCIAQFYIAPGVLSMCGGYTPDEYDLQWSDMLGELFPERICIKLFIVTRSHIHWALGMHHMRTNWGKEKSERMLVRDTCCLYWWLACGLVVQGITV